MHPMDLAAKVKEGIQAEDMVGYRFNTIGVSDGISMGTPGMSFSLQSRDLIADSIETVMGGQWYDANVSLPGCDKNMPGCIIAMGRLNRPAIMIYGGTIKPGSSSQGEPLDIVSAFQSYGQYVTGAIDEETRCDIVRKSCPERAPAAACTRPTPWPPPSRRSACPSPTLPPSPPRTPSRWTSASWPARRSSTSSRLTSSPATS